MSFTLNNPLNLDICENSSGTKRDSQGSTVDRSRRGETGRRGPEEQQHHIQESRFEGAAIGRANSSSSINGGGYRSIPHHHHHLSGNTYSFSHSSSSTLSTVAAAADCLPEVAHVNCVYATMLDPQISDIVGGVPNCGGGGARPIVVPPIPTSRRSPWAVSSTTSSLTDSVPSNDDPSHPSWCVDYCCTSESTAEPSHSCDPNSHQDRRPHFSHHPHQQQQQRHQVDLSTSLAPSRADTPLPAARDAPELLSSNEDQCGVSAQQQGIASTPAAAVAVADQEFPPFASTIPNSWNSSPSPAPSFGSFSSAHSSNLSSETEFGGGAPITADDIDDILRNKHLSSRANYRNKKSSEAPDIDEEDDEEDSDGGIEVDHSDSDMTSSGPVEVLYSPSALHAIAMDEDEDDFSPNNLVTRPPSPVGGGSSFLMDIFSSPPYESPPENIIGEPPSFAMHLDPPLGDWDFQPNIAETPLPPAAPLDSYSPSPPTPSTPAEYLIDSSSPDVQVSISRGTDGLEIATGEDEELFVVESELNNSPGQHESMPSQSSSQSPPTVAVVVSPAVAAAVAAASGIMAAVAGVGGVIPSPTRTSPPSPTIPPPLPLFLSPHLPHVSAWTPTTFPPNDILDGGIFSEEDEFDDITNHPFEHNLPLEDIENYNKDFTNFCMHAYYRYRMNPTKYPKLSTAAGAVRHILRPSEVTRAEVEGNGWDYQAIPWDVLGISSEVARGIRRKEYVNYLNVKDLIPEDPIGVPANRNFFEFRRMDNEQRCRLIHFQLRNLLGVVSKNDVFYAGDALVLHTNPLTGRLRPVMDLRTPESWSGNPIRISTLGTCGGANGVVIAGCFHGEYAMKPLNAAASAKPVTGIVTKNESGITNHVQMIKNRTTGTPNAVFSSNDFFIRVLNCGEGMRFISEHRYPWPVNCSVTSPDSRLRVVVGDDTEVLICDAERGTTEFVLKGHRDFGFAAAWSDDGYTIATGNQDKTVRIFDARNLNQTVKVLPAVMAGVRTLRFSPIGYGGKRVLAMAEPADVVQIVDAVSWDSLQQIDFWGEVGGIDFDPSGEEFYIANADKCVGGIMEFSRTKGAAYYEDYGRENAQQRHRAEKNVRRRRRKRTSFIASSDEDSESTAPSDEEPVEDDVEEQQDTRKRGRYYDSRRYKRLGHDMSNVFV